MSGVLDSTEVNALLDSVASGEQAEPSAQAQDGAGPTDAGEPRVEVRPYDFHRPECVGRDQIRALAGVYEVFARNLGATLSGMLRTIVDVRLVGVDQLTYSDFIQSLPNPTCFATLAAPPLEGRMCLEFSPPVVYPIIERLLGGGNASPFIPQRALTEVEWRLIARLMDRVLEHLSEAWRSLVSAEFRLVGRESNPQLVQIVAPTEVVVCATFELKFDPNAGTLSLCIPYHSIESPLSGAATQAWLHKPQPPSEAQQARLRRNLELGTVGVTAYLGRSEIRLSELRGLRKGDLIPLQKRTRQALLLRIGGRNKFAGTAGQVRGKRALRITRAAAAEEPL